MNTADNPYSAPESRWRYDALTVDQESFFAVMWPSIAFSVLIIGVILGVERFVPAARLEHWTSLIPAFLLSVVAHFVAARRIERWDGGRRSIVRSSLICVASTVHWCFSLACGVLVLNIFRIMSGQTRGVPSLAEFVFITAPVYALMTAVVFQACIRDFRFRHAFLINAMAMAVILSAYFWAPDYVFRYKYTFVTSCLTLLAHCNCFAWWYATPKW